MEYTFTFIFVSQAFPPIAIICIACDCDTINRPGELDLLTSNRFEGTRVMGFHHANFGLPRPLKGKL